MLYLAPPITAVDHAHSLVVVGPCISPPPLCVFSLPAWISVVNCRTCVEGHLLYPLSLICQTSPQKTPAFGREGGEGRQRGREGKVMGEKVRRDEGDGEGDEGKERRGEGEGIEKERRR